MLKVTLPGGILPPSHRPIEGSRMAARGGASSVPPDSELVLRARQGDRAAFDQLARRHAPRLYAYTRQVLRDPDEAMDVTQEAMIRAWRGLEGFRGGEEFRSWLFQIATNLARDRFRARARRPGMPAEDADALGLLPDPQPGPDVLAERAEFRARLDAGMARLSPEHREILALRAVEDMSYEEIAAALGVAIGTVMSRLARARSRLRELMEDCP